MKKSDELKQERYNLLTEIRELPNSGLEKRELEKKENELSTKVHEISGDILKAEREEKEAIDRAIRNGTKLKTGADNDLDRFSFTRAIRVAMGVEKGGIEEEMNQDSGFLPLFLTGHQAAKITLPTLMAVTWLDLVE